jgi:Phage integrase, N-terminal SAM-like domain
MKPPRKLKRKDGSQVWEVRYREGGRHRSKVFDRKSNAMDFQAEVRRRKQLGTIAQLHAGDDLLADFAVEWWRLHAKPNLEPTTLGRYSQVWDNHVLPWLGGYRLKELTPEVVNEFRVMLADKGVGDATIRKAMFILQSVMGLAVLHGKVATNSVKAVKKPRQRSRRVRPLAPITVEPSGSTSASATPRSSLCSPTPACALARPSASSGRTCASGPSSSTARSRWAARRAPRRTRPAPCGSCRR